MNFIPNYAGSKWFGIQAADPRNLPATNTSLAALKPTYARASVYWTPSGQGYDGGQGIDITNTGWTWTDKLFALNPYRLIVNICCEDADVPAAYSAIIKRYGIKIFAVNVLGEPNADTDLPRYTARLNQIRGIRSQLASHVKIAGPGFCNSWYPSWYDQWKAVLPLLDIITAHCYWYTKGNGAANMQGTYLHPDQATADGIPDFDTQLKMLLGFGKNAILEEFGVPAEVGDAAIAAAVLRQNNVPVCLNACYAPDDQYPWGCWNVASNRWNDRITMFCNTLAMR